MTILNVVSSIKKLSKHGSASLLLLLCLSLSACSTPWVKPYERGLIADPIMNPDRNPVSSGYMHHVYQSRELARGAEGGSGGGCGCN